MVFGQRQAFGCVLGIDLTRTREHEPPDPGIGSGVQQNPRALYVGLVHARVVGRCPGHDGTEVQNDIRTHDGVGDIRSVLEPADTLGVAAGGSARGPRIETGDGMPGIQERVDRARTDTPGSSCDQDPHRSERPLVPGVEEVQVGRVE